MVGILHSKGCFRCIKKKKRCDARRPTCLRCEKQGVSCPGYRDPFRPQFAEEPTPEEQTPESTTVVAQTKPLVRDIGQLATRLLSSNASRQQITGQFREIYFPGRRHQWPELRADITEVTPWHFFPSIFERNTTDPLLTEVVLGFMLGVLPAEVDTDTLAYSRELLYRRTYARLGRRMNDPELRLSDEVLASVMMLGYYEGETNWDGCVTHVKGTNALVQARGILNFATPFARRLFWCAHHAQLNLHWFSDHWYTGRPSRDELTYRVPPPTAMQLTDDTAIICLLWALPELVETVNRICNAADSSPEDDSHAVGILARLTDLEAALLAWYKEFTHKPPYWEMPSMLFELEHNTAYPAYLSTCFCFPSIVIADQIRVYWTASLVLNEAKGRLQRHIGREDSRDEHDTRKARSRSFVQLLLQGSEFYVHPDVGVGAAWTIDVSATITVLQSFVRGEEMFGEEKWILLLWRIYNGAATCTPINWGRE